MSNSTEETYRVNAYSDPVVVKIVGRASYTNTAPLNDFFHCVFKKGRSNFLIDFKDCTGMDSTFLGIIAGISLEARSAQPKGNVALCRLNSRNLELVKNLGLHRIADVLNDSVEVPSMEASNTLKDMDQSEQDSARMILEAHENLVKVDDANEAKFQDVISFLKNQVEET